MEYYMPIHDRNRYHAAYAITCVVHKNTICVLKHILNFNGNVYRMKYRFLVPLPFNYILDNMKSTIYV